MRELTLTPDQQAAYEAFCGFITDPNAEAFVLKGYAGTGKSTLVNKLLADLPKLLQTVNLIMQNDTQWDVVLTATTNKAAEALAAITNREVKTIQSLLGLRVKTDYKTNQTELVPAQRRGPTPRRAIIFVDEASYIDAELLTYIFDLTSQCKLVFIGDPAQLAPINSTSTPVFNAGFTTAELKQVVRQAEGNQIIDLATAFRNTVNGEPWIQFAPDNAAVVHLPRARFESAILSEFDRGDWHHNDSKVLAWTNRTVITYNHGIREHVQGMPELAVGDYAVCNRFLQNRNCKIKTDQTVLVTAIEAATDKDVDGWHVELDHTHHAFLPRSLAAWKAREKQARQAEDWNTVHYIDTHWIDLRAAYACTINKSQGSTYNRVFIDLDDIKKCHSANQLARLMYVGVSRAREQVIMTGDLV